MPIHLLLFSLNIISYNFNHFNLYLFILKFFFSQATLKQPSSSNKDFSWNFQKIKIVVFVCPVSGC